MYYVLVDGVNSVKFDLLMGTVQGSILGLILYSIFFSSIFDEVFMLRFADDNYLTKVNCTILELISYMDQSLESITEWLKDSGLVVNQNKTELCLFFKRDVATITINMGNYHILPKRSSIYLVSPMTLKSNGQTK
jgi:hypothetical protein